MLELKPMNQDMYNNYIKNSIQQYAEEIAKSRGIDFDKALQLTNEEFNTLLPEGLKSKNQFLNVIINDKNEKIGIMWFSTESNHGDNEAFFFCDIEINKEYRGKGYGRESMKLLESKIKEFNLGSICLHVFLRNEIACTLYNKIGYQEIKRGKAGVIMKKTLKEAL